MSGATFTPAGGGGGSSVAIASGTAAARPAAAAGNANTGYFATDTGELTVSNGAAWQSIAGTSATLFKANLGGNVAAIGQVHIAQPGLTFPGFGELYDVGTDWTFNNTGLDIITAGRGLRVAEGANAKQGVSTLVAGTVTVANTSITASSRIMLTPQDNSTVGAVRVSARSVGTSFTILSSNLADTGVVAWQIFEPG